MRFWQCFLGLLEYPASLHWKLISPTTCKLLSERINNPLLLLEDPVNHPELQGVSLGKILSLCSQQGQIELGGGPSAQTGGGSAGSGGGFRGGSVEPPSSGRTIQNNGANGPVKPGAFTGTPYDGFPPSGLANVVGKSPSGSSLSSSAHQGPQSSHSTLAGSAQGLHSGQQGYLIVPPSYSAPAHDSVDTPPVPGSPTSTNAASDPSSGSATTGSLAASGNGLTPVITSAVPVASGDKTGATAGTVNSGTSGAETDTGASGSSSAGGASGSPTSASAGTSPSPSGKDFSGNTQPNSIVGAEPVIGRTGGRPPSSSRPSNQGEANTGTGPLVSQSGGNGRGAGAGNNGDDGSPTGTVQQNGSGTTGSAGGSPTSQGNGASSSEGDGDDDGDDDFPFGTVQRNGSGGTSSSNAGSTPPQTCSALGCAVAHLDPQGTESNLSYKFLSDERASGAPPRGPLLSKGELTQCPQGDEYDACVRGFR